MYTLKQFPEDFIVKEISNVKIKDQGKYYYYLLKKRNRNTLDVIKELAKQLGIKERLIGFAGSKDKHALTEQVISIPNKVREVKIDNVELKYLGKGDQPISLGDLKGNQFEIIVRNTTKTPQKITFVENYFDEQRFSKNNAKIGKHLIKKEFQEAVKLIDNPRVQQHLPKTDSVGALRKLPLRLLKMYVHAYQSYLWNETLAAQLEGKELEYSLGKFVFTNNNKKLTIPLIGFSELNDPIIKIIMDKEKITNQDFIIKQIPELSMEGDNRQAFVKINNLEIKKLEKNIIKVKFTLPKGSYATMVIRKLLLQ
tara:strand:+ start:754 stop:1686 length:933 start_codon:yes stop_codon:yes gene_type:complete